MINLIGQVLNGVLIWNVLDHQSGSWIVADCEWINLEDSVVIISYFIDHNVLRVRKSSLLDEGVIVVWNHHMLRVSVEIMTIIRIPIDGTGQTDVFSIRT